MALKEKGWSMYLLEGIVCQKDHEEPGNAGGPANFLLGATINDLKADLSNPVMMADKTAGLSDNLFKLNGNNKCQCHKTNCTHHLPPPSIASPQPVASPQSDSSALNDQIDEQVLVKRKMPKRKRKFGKGATMLY
jgi:hypothetical protein